MLSPVVQEALNEQISTELFSSYNYLAMSAYCDSVSFRGCAQWLRVQSQEEYQHAMKLYDFLLARNGKVVLREIRAPRIAYGSLGDVFQESLKQEEEVSRRIDSLYELAFKEKAFAALVELQWFISEQVEEERTVRDIVAKFELLKDDPSALLDLDRELGERTAEEEADTAESAS